MTAYRKSGYSKKKAYADYRSARKEMQDYLIARKNIKVILGMDQDQIHEAKQENCIRLPICFPI